jgi:hypothetical protein
MKHFFHFTHIILSVALIAATTAKKATAQETSGITRVRGTLTGSRVAVFDTAKDSCELIDIPDAPARAFRDYQGTIHLVSSHYVMRASLGTTLNTVKHNCEVAFRSKHDPNPANFDDTTWLDSFFSIDGKSIVALGHMEYHGWAHPGECSIRWQYTPTCWYNADTFNFSTDGGYHFESPAAPTNFVAGLPYQYEVNQGPEGYSIDTNIVKLGKWYYAVATDWPWPPNCGQTGQPQCLVPFGGAPIRTSNILDPSSWRAWSGKGFWTSFADPYPGPVSDPKSHVYTPIQYLDSVNAINYNEARQLFVATYYDPYDRAFGGPPGVYLATSPDLVTWSKPTLLVSVAELLAKEPPGNWSYAYFSLLDPNATDDNFSTITNTPSLYYVRLDDNHGPYVRVLFRQRINLTWQ